MIDELMRQVLARLELLSFGQTTKLGGTPSSHWDFACPPGESNPPHLIMRARYEAAADDVERLLCVFDARALYRDLTRRKQVIIREETASEFLARVLEAKGWPARDVAVALRCSASQVRRLRTENGCDPETGHPAVLDVRALRAKGISWRDIGRLLDQPQSTVRYRFYKSKQGR